MPNFLHKTLHEPRTSGDTQAFTPFLFQKLHFFQLKSSEIKNILILIVSVMRDLVQGLYFGNEDDPHRCDFWLFRDDKFVVLIEVRLVCGFKEDDVCGGDWHHKNRYFFLDCLKANEGIVQAEFSCYWIVIVLVRMVFAYFLHDSEFSFQIHQLQHKLGDLLEDMYEFEFRLPWLTDKIHEDIPIIFQWRLGERSSKVNLRRLKRKSFAQSNQYTNFIHL